MNAAAAINPELEALTAGLPDETREALRGLVGGLESKVGGLQSKVGGLQSKVGELEILIRLREEQLRMARMDKYGPRSEKLSASQLQLLDLEPGVQLAEVEAEASRQDSEKKVAAAPEDKQRKKRAAYSRAHPGRSPLPAHLPRKEVISPCEEAPDGPLVGYEVREELVIKPITRPPPGISPGKRRARLGRTSRR